MSEEPQLPTCPKCMIRLDEFIPPVFRCRQCAELFVRISPEIEFCDFQVKEMR